MWHLGINLGYTLTNLSFFTAMAVYATNGRINLIPLMGRLDLRLCHIMSWEFKQRNSAMETFRKICSVYVKMSGKDETDL